MNYLPAWVYCIPDKRSPNYITYLVNDAAKDGVPTHVIARLIYQYYHEFGDTKSEDNSNHEDSNES